MSLENVKVGDRLTVHRHGGLGSPPVFRFSIVKAATKTTVTDDKVTVVELKCDANPALSEPDTPQGIFKPTRSTPASSADHPP